MTAFTVTLGTHRSVNKLKDDLIGKGFKISDWAQKFLPKIKLAKKKTTLELEVVTVAELGFPDGGKVKDIYAKAQELGYALPPAEAALQLRLQYTDQPLDEWLIVAHEPIAVAYGDLSVLYVVRDSVGSWVHGYYADPVDVWGAEDRLVFCRKSLAARPLAPSGTLAPCPFSEDEIRKLKELAGRLK
jgi:hypothetical protein